MLSLCPTHQSSPCKVQAGSDGEPDHRCLAISKAASPGAYRGPNLTRGATSHRSTENPSSLLGSADFPGRLLCSLFCQLCNAEVFELFATLECCRQPAWLQSAAGPDFARIFRIAVFRGDRAACPKPAPFGT